MTAQIQGTTDAQFLYVVLILPSMFGFILIGEGLNRLLKSETMGILNIFFGFAFTFTVVFVYLYLSGRIAV